MKENLKLVIEKRNSEVFLRPRFSITLKENYKVILNRFSDELKKKEIPFRGNIIDEHVFISVAKKEEHFWSPQLHLEIVKSTEELSILKGLFGPKPQVWTLFMFVHFVIGVTFLGFCVMLYSKISLNESVFLPLTMIIVLPIIWIVLYFLGKIGKDTGKNQMKELHEFMIRVIGY
ncbi:GTP-binding protein [Polaribacter sargassicola]|uniref:GTP-binding protein n=1 Tax=Polaribacter sargassicola TaxID=2836891 RepID=UPI001F2A66F0|nr:GTP-binding protein [Polaribacter sp. DS7-9]MCG1037500.1 GTP-binding protein [Polaribacter sp. DS7-9]